MLPFGRQTARSLEPTLSERRTLEIRILELLANIETVAVSTVRYVENEFERVRVTSKSVRRVGR
jgi:hypothetical protein